MNFYVGQKVTSLRNVCGWKTDDGRPAEGPKPGDILTIIVLSYDELFKRDLLRFAERPRKYSAINFRPVVKRKTSITIFKKMLLPAPAKHTEPA